MTALARGVVAVGFDGRTAADAPIGALRDFAPGAIILFARNAGTAHEIRELVAALRAAGDPAPLIAVDQEGGRVERIRDGVAPLPPAMAVGAANDPARTEELGVLTGRDLARLGVSVNLAPVADLALHPRGTVIATRAYGDDPAHVAQHASAFARGLERGGVAAALKHFPGHGSTAADSHAVLPRIAASEAELRAHDLVPFARAIAARDASIVLTAHVVVDAFDRERPATLSHAILTGLLRDELGFRGVAMTDCLEMDAIAAGAGTVPAAVAALAAGADLVLISHRLELAHAAANAIVAAVEDGTLPRARLAEAHARVHALRTRLAELVPYAAELDEHAAESVARRAVTVLRGEPRLRDGKPVTVISFEGAASDAAAMSGARGTPAGPSLSAALRRRGRKSEIMRVPLDPDADDVDLLLEHVPALGDRDFVVTVRDAHLHDAQRAAVARILRAAPSAIVVSARAPFDAALWPEAGTVLCIYGDGELMMDACAGVLTGAVRPHGVPPVRIVRDAAVR